MFDSRYTPVSYLEDVKHAPKDNLVGKRVSFNGVNFNIGNFRNTKNFDLEVANTEVTLSIVNGMIAIIYLMGAPVTTGYRSTQGSRYSLQYLKDSKLLPESTVNTIEDFITS